MFLPGSRGFDYYLGIPFSDDMGEGRRSSCDSDDVAEASGNGSDDEAAFERYHKDKDGWMWRMYEDMGYTLEEDVSKNDDPLLPLVYVAMPLCFVSCGSRCGICGETAVVSDLDAVLALRPLQQQHQRRQQVPGGQFHDLGGGAAAGPHDAGAEVPEFHGQLPEGERVLGRPLLPLHALLSRAHDGREPAGEAVRRLRVAEHHHARSFRRRPC